METAPFSSPNFISKMFLVSVWGSVTVSLDAVIAPLLTKHHTDTAYMQRFEYLKKKILLAVCKAYK